MIRWSGSGVWGEIGRGPDLHVAHMCADLAMMHSIEDAETFRH